MTTEREALEQIVATVLGPGAAKGEASKSEPVSENQSTRDEAAFIAEHAGVSRETAERLLGEYAPDASRLSADEVRATANMVQTFEAMAARERGEHVPEPVSENRGRGRPRAWHEMWATCSHSKAKTVRGVQNRRLASAAYFTLRGAWEPAFAWFWGRSPCSKEECFAAELVCIDSDRRCVRWGVLTELGRLEHDEDILEAARIVATWDPEVSVRAVVARLRAVRTGRKGSAYKLSKRLAKVVADYTLENPDVDLWDAHAAIGGVREHIVNVIAETEPDEPAELDRQIAEAERPTEPPSDPTADPIVRVRVEPTVRVRLSVDNDQLCESHSSEDEQPIEDRRIRVAALPPEPRSS